MTEKKKVVVDTSALMEEPEYFESVIKDYNIILPITVLEELDNLKTNKIFEKQVRAKKAIKFIEVYFDEIQFDTNEYKDSEKNDNKILLSAIKNEASIMTNDICLKVKSKIVNVEVIEIYRNGKYKGYSVMNLDLDNEEDGKILADIYEKRKIEEVSLHINEYLIIRDINDKTIDIFRWDGEYLKDLKLPNKKVVSPKNDLQMCALDLLMAEEVPIKIVAGVYGSGKTMLSTLVGLNLVEKGHYSKLVLVRSTDTQESGDIGFLPGTFEDKTNILFQTMIQHFPQGEFQAEKMKNAGLLEMHIPYFMKGLSISGFMLVDESEDLTLSDLRKIGARIEEDSAIVFAGDWKQANGRYKSDSGMVKLINQTKDEPLVGVIVLDSDVRSMASKIFVDLY